MPIDVAGDVRRILEDSSGFGRTITLTDPYGKSADVTGRWFNIGTAIDVETGVVVTARQASFTVSIASLRAAGLTGPLPAGIHDSKHKPWVVTFKDLAGGDLTFKVLEGRPSESQGFLTCTLEAWRG